MLEENLAPLPLRSPPSPIWSAHAGHSGLGSRSQLLVAWNMARSSPLRLPFTALKRVTCKFCDRFYDWPSRHMFSGCFCVLKANACPLLPLYKRLQLVLYYSSNSRFPYKYLPFSARLTLLPWRWIKLICPKPYYLPFKPHGAPTQETVISYARVLDNLSPLKPRHLSVVPVPFCIFKHRFPFQSNPN